MDAAKGQQGAQSLFKHVFTARETFTHQQRGAKRASSLVGIGAKAEIKSQSGLGSRPALCQNAIPVRPF